jgi:hypothetical protein
MIILPSHYIYCFMTKRFITFETISEPIDQDDEQSAVKPLFTGIVEELVRLGAEIIEGPAEWDSYGWYAEFQLGTAKLTCIMQRSDSWLLLVDAHRSLMDKLKGRQYHAELDAFAEMLVVSVGKAMGVPAKLFNSEAEFRAG